MIEEKFQEMLLKDKIMIDVRDSVVGQVNGLSSSRPKNMHLAIPHGSLPELYIGSNGVTNIERETK